MQAIEIKKLNLLHLSIYLSIIVNRKQNDAHHSLQIFVLNIRFILTLTLKIFLKELLTKNKGQTTNYCFDIRELGRWTMHHVILQVFKLRQ
jgi:hypothetical protein